MHELPTFHDIEDAARLIAGTVLRTPLLENAVLSRLLGFRLLIKPENLQRTGSFKFRGASNFVKRLSDAQRAKGVIAYSSGNHAQGLAMAASMLGTPATIIMPHDAPLAKIEGVRAMGATADLFERYFEDRDAAIEEAQRERGVTFIPPFDHPFIIAGQGTAGIEIAEEARARSIDIDRVYIPCSGGGLAAGVALAMSRLLPKSTAVLVEPEGYADFDVSLNTGVITPVQEMRPTLCDGLRTPQPGAVPFDVIRRLDVDTATISDDAAMQAIAQLFKYFRIVAEPSGAASLAAITNEREALQGKVVVAIVSGGNIDPLLFSSAIGRS